MEEFFPEDMDGGELSRDGRVMEMLSEHTMEGMLEGYLLTGRHGFLSTYESFVHVIDSMFNQHAKWLEMSRQIPWRQAIASLNLLITSTVWRHDESGEPDVVMASAGDIPTQEALAATALLRKEFPDLKIRFVNIIDLFKLQPNTEHPHGLSDRDFDSLFTTDKPIIFNFHGYPQLI